MNLKKLLPLLGIVLTTLLFSCQKDNLDQNPLEKNAATDEVISKAKKTKYYSISIKGRYLSRENGKKNMTANRTKIGSWEKFEIIDAGHRQIVLKGTNGKYVREAVNEYNGKKYKRLKCDTNYKYKARRFFFNGDYDNPVVKFNGLKIASWKKNDRVIVGHNGTTFVKVKPIKAKKKTKKKTLYAFKGTKGYLSSENGKGPMTAYRDNIGAWEKFEVIKTKSRGTLYKLKCNNGKFAVIKNTAKKGKKPIYKLFCTGKTKGNAHDMSDLFDNLRLRTQTNLGTLKIIKL